MRGECARYVCISGTAASVGLGDDGGDAHGNDMPISGERLISLYTSLKQGQSLKTWCIEHAEQLEGIDVRRLVTFGVIKGFLYRVHKYAIATTTATITRSSGGENLKGGSQTEMLPSSSARDDGGGVKERGQKKSELGRYLDGTYCFDEICTELGISERELVGELKRWGDVQIIHR